MKRSLLLALSSLFFVAPLFVTPAADATVRHATYVALNQRGDWYRYGAEGPARFDCSGLVYYSFRHAGFGGMPRTAQQQYNHTRHISRSNMRRGDLFFYHGSNGHVFHVAIYLGHGRTVSATHTGTRVHAGRTWQAPRWAGTMR